MKLLLPLIVILMAACAQPCKPSATTEQTKQEVNPYSYLRPRPLSRPEERPTPEPPIRRDGKWSHQLMRACAQIAIRDDRPWDGRHPEATCTVEEATEFMNSPEFAPGR
jgi:hypothetical protein